MLIDIVPSQPAMAFHYYCDKYNFEKKCYFIHVGLGIVLIVLVKKQLMKYFDYIELERRLHIILCIYMNDKVKANFSSRYINGIGSSAGKTMRCS